MNWTFKASRVPAVACKTPTSARMIQVSHSLPTACPRCSVMYELGLESIQSSSCKATGQAPTSARMVKMSHVWPTACPSCSVMHELAQEAPRVPPVACKTPTSARMVKMSHVWPTACPSCMHELGSGSTESAYSCMQDTNKCKNGQNESCFAQSISQMLSHASTGLRKHPECLQLQRH
jgi:hypothetical protein